MIPRQAGTAGRTAGQGTLLRPWLLCAASSQPVTLARHVHLTSHLPLNDLLGHPNVSGTGMFIPVIDAWEGKAFTCL
eukprot:1148663-Pelagomonas_calceolata.AAC.9